MDAQTRAWIDQQAAELTATIRRHGWAIQYVSGGPCSYPGCDCSSGDEPPFAYTIGLFGMGHPELLILGLDPGSAGETLVPGQLITFDEWPHRIVPEPVPNPGEIVLGANDFYQRPTDHSVPVLQLSYDDLDGRFPWEDGYAAPGMQPRPGAFRV